MQYPWIVLPALALLAACADPLAGIDRVSDLPPGTAPEDGPTLATPADEDPDAPILAGLFTGDEDAAGTASPVAEKQAAPQPRQENRGLLGWLRGSAETKAGTAAVQTASLDPDTAQGAGLAVDAEKAAAVTATEDPAPPRRGLFGPRIGATRDGPDARDVPVGTRLPFGRIARVCDARAGDMGPVVEEAARRGRGYRLHDSAPGSVGPRTFYVTGFADNCPRQFTAALALFGTAEAHEQLRYGPAAANYPYSSTDEAYERIKSQVCRVGRKKPCGARITRFDRTTIFISAYENFGASARWTDILLHDGAVLAAALKGP